MNDASLRMTLNHLSFPSNDVVATASFFEKQLSCRVTPFGTSRLAKRPGFDIVIEDAAEHPIAWPRNFHLGLELKTVEALEATFRRFEEEGVTTMRTAVFYHPRGSRFFCEAPGGLLVEINTRFDATDDHRRTFDSQNVADVTSRGINAPVEAARPVDSHRSS